MKTVECWFWLIPTLTPRGERMVRTRYRMDEATALEAQPEAVKAPGTMELRNVPETDDDWRANFSGAWQQSK
jgi:hypothetical protein